MKHITNLIGYDALKKHLDNEASLLVDYIIPASSQNNRTMIAHYVLESLMAAHPRCFGEVDKILEYSSFSGSMSEAERILADIYNKTERYNSFKGIITLCMDDLAKHLNSKAVEFILDKLSGEIGKDSVIIAFVSEKMTANERELVNRFKLKRGKPALEFGLEDSKGENTKETQCNCVAIKDVVAQNTFAKA